MKRLGLIILAAALLLTACGKRKETGTVPEKETVQEPTCGETPAETGDYAIACEWEEYAPDVERITFFVENLTEEPLETGVDFRLERLEENGEWVAVPMAEPAAWVALGVHISAGGYAPMECFLSGYDYDFSGGGTFRIVKELNGQPVAGLFRLTEDAGISADQPYGFPPLEELPADFCAADADGDEVVFTAEGAANLAAVERFLERSGSGVDCQLRTVQDYGEGTPMVIDVIFENSHFLWRMWSQGDVTERRFSYIVTDGIDLYLSNGADWTQTERYGSDTAFLIPQGVTGAMLTAAEQQAAGRMEHSVIRYRVWSEDGVCDAALTDAPTEFSVGWQKQGEGSRGELFDIRNFGGGETAVLALEWQGSDLLLTCEAAGDKGLSRLVFNTECWSLTDRTN